MFRICIAILFILLSGGVGLALEPNEILIITNSEINESSQIAHYYCIRRNVPMDNIISLPLGKNLSAGISRNDYNKKLVSPIYNNLLTPKYAGKIKCLLTTYGVPVKVGRREKLKDLDDKLKELKELLEQQRSRLKFLQQSTTADAREQAKQLQSKISKTQSRIDYILGVQTDASVDSELSMVLFGDYELYRYRPNMLKNGAPACLLQTLMVSRLDGPTPQIPYGLIDKAIKAESAGLSGYAYIDTRGIVSDNDPYSYGYFDQSLRDLALLTMFRTRLKVKKEETAELFQPGDCPDTAIYCGWYSLKKYIDAFDFVDGAVGYHIASFEAADLRDPNSTQWCSAMLKDGITATFGAVAEPYLHAFPEPRKFFLELYDGRCLVETFYHTKPFNSWQFVLIGDPLYRPFKKD